MPKIVDHDQRRREIVDALWRVVERDGARAVSVRSVAAEAGLSKTGMSHYFASQSELLAVAIEQSIDSVNLQVDQLDLSHITPELATQALLLLVPAGSEHRQRALVWLEVLNEASSDPASQAVLTRLNEETRKGILRVVEGLKASGYLAVNRDVAREAAILHGLIDGLSLQTVTDEPFLTAAEVAVLIRTQVGSLQ